jgi:type IV pilus assembly protein PilC
VPKFTYKALRKNGEEYEGSLEAESRFDVYDLVGKEGGTVVSYKEAGHFSFSLKNFDTFFSSVKTKDVVIFTRNLSTMIAAGLSLVRALGIVERQTSNAKLKSITTALRLSLEGGKSFHDALAEHPKTFSQLVVSMSRAGEESGKLADTLKLVALQMDRMHELSRRIRGALIYPAIIVTALVGIGVLLLIFVVPTLQSTFIELGVDLPLSTRFILAFSSFVSNNVLATIAGFIVIIASFIFGLRTPYGKRGLDFALLHIPMISPMVRETNAARTTRTLASLLSSGVSVVNAIDITAEVVQNSYYRDILLKGKDSIQRGAPISEIFSNNEDKYPPLVGELVSVGEETGQLSDMLLYVAEFYEKEVEEKTRNLSTIVEPFLMLIVGAVVGFFAIAMITPIYSVVDVI